MSDRDLHLYLDAGYLASAKAGKFNLLERMKAALAPLGAGVQLHLDTAEGRALAETRAGWSLFHMHEPTAPQILNLRRAYHYPFWRIEKTNDRWNFDVARQRFEPSEIDPIKAHKFTARWRERIHGSLKVARDGFILIPLQGQIRQHRAFQAMSPLEMIEAVIARYPTRALLATLHPREDYSPEDLAALEAISQRHPNFQVTPALPALLGACDLVVTQNSAVALNGFFLGKPAVLFAKTDFHHIAGSVPHDGVEEAFARATEALPPFAAYLYWFFIENAINGGSDAAETQIIAALSRQGWQP